MAMVFCRGCARHIHETAPMCPGCGAPQGLTPPANGERRNGSLWMGITSLVLGIICGLALLDDSGWDRDTLTGLGLFSTTGLVLGIVSIKTKNSGTGLAIAGTVLSAVSLMLLVGLCLN